MEYALKILKRWVGRHRSEQRFHERKAKILDKGRPSKALDAEKELAKKEQEKAEELENTIIILEQHKTT